MIIKKARDSSISQKETLSGFSIQQRWGPGGGEKGKEEKKKNEVKGGHHIVHNQGILAAAMV